MLKNDISLREISHSIRKLTKATIVATNRLVLNIIFASWSCQRTIIVWDCSPLIEFLYSFSSSQARSGELIRLSARLAFPFGNYKNSNVPMVSLHALFISTKFLIIRKIRHVFIFMLIHSGNSVPDCFNIDVSHVVNISFVFSCDDVKLTANFEKPLRSMTNKLWHTWHSGDDIFITKLKFARKKFHEWKWGRWHKKTIIAQSFMIQTNLWNEASSIWIVQALIRTPVLLGGNRCRIVIEWKTKFALIQFIQYSNNCKII